VNLPDGSGESYKESATIEKGTTLATILESPVGRLAVAVCYDLRFPELFRALLEGGLDVIAIPAAFTEKTGRAHWELLLRARAVENQCYLIGANQGGLHENGRTTFGNSLIVDPWGVILARKGKGEGVVAATFDSVKQNEIRAQFPVLAHRQKYH
jgi:nitrilase